MRTARRSGATATVKTHRTTCAKRSQRTDIVVGPCDTSNGAHHAPDGARPVPAMRERAAQRTLARATHPPLPPVRPPSSRACRTADPSPLCHRISRRPCVRHGFRCLGREWQSTTSLHCAGGGCALSPMPLDASNPLLLCMSRRASVPTACGAYERVPHIAHMCVVLGAHRSIAATVFLDAPRRLAPAPCSSRRSMGNRIAHSAALADADVEHVRRTRAPCAYRCSSCRTAAREIRQHRAAPGARRRVRHRVPRTAWRDSCCASGSADRACVVSLVPACDVLWHDM